LFWRGRSLFKREQVPVHFLHVGKTGGTAIIEALRPVAEEYRIVLHPHSTKLSDVPHDHRVFFFVRHPLTRFVSGFYSRLRRGMPRYCYEWSEAEAEAFQHFQNANNLAEALSAADEETASRAHAAMQGILHVKSTYREWFSGEQELDQRLESVVLVGLQEKLKEDFEDLKSLLRLPKTLELPQDDVLAHRNPPTSDRRLSPVAMHNLSQWYADDIRFYEHCLQLRVRRGL